MIAFFIQFVSDERPGVKIVFDFDSLFIIDIAWIFLSIAVVDLEDFFVNFPVSGESEPPDEDVDGEKPDEEVAWEIEICIDVLAERGELPGDDGDGAVKEVEDESEDAYEE